MINELTYNREVCHNFDKPPPDGWPEVRVKQRRIVEIEVVKTYMDYYDTVIEERILANNENLYTSMGRFLLAA